MATESQVITKRKELGPQAAGPQYSGPPMIDGVPMDQYVQAERLAQSQGGTLQQTDEGKAFDPEKKGLQLFGMPEGEKLLFTKPIKQQIADNYAWNTAHEDAVLNGDQVNLTKRALDYKQNPTVKDALVEQLYQMYTDDHLDYGVLSNLDGLEPDEQIARVMYEVNRHDLNKLNSKQHLLIHMMRAGLGTLPEIAADESWMTLDTEELEALGGNLKLQQQEQLRFLLDQIYAPLGEGFTTTAGIGEIIQQDFVPVYSAVTRVLTSRAIVPDEVELGSFRGLLPGEIRQEIREWFAGASHEDRTKYLSDVAREVEKLRKGPYAAHFTRYGILESLIGTFSEDLLTENISKDTLDRVLGNLDVVLEALYAGILFKKVGQPVAGLFRANNVSSVRQAARAAGNHSVVASLDNQLRTVAERFEVTPAESAIVDLPRPAGLRDNMEILPDEVKEVLENAEVLRTNILGNTDDVTGQGLTTADKNNVVRETVRELDWGDRMHVNHRMMTIEGLPNDVGFRVTAVIGETPSGGWRYFDDMVDELVDLDPNLELFEIVRRGPTGNIVPLGVTPDELARFVTKGEVPVTVEQRLAPESATSRLFGGRRLTTVSRDELLDVAQEIDSAGPDFQNIMNELTRRRDGIDQVNPLRSLDGDEFFLRLTQDRYWHTLDKQGFNAETFLNTGILPRPLVAPNGKFGDDIFGAFNSVYLKEQSALRDFNYLYKPYYDLNNTDKLVVEQMFEWAEDFAKAQADLGGLARAPTFEELAVQFDGLTIGQMKGYAAIRTGMDVQYELFNRRLYRDMHTRGVKTARAVGDDTLPNYHGVERARAEARPGHYFDPITQEVVMLSRSDLDDIYNAGGGTIKLDFPIDAPAGGKFDRVLARAGDYEIGPLSRKPLNYYEGYHMRFYEDPVYIIKHTENAEINGVATKEAYQEAIRTAGSTPEAERFLRRYGRPSIDGKGRYVSSRDPNVSYEIRPAKDINNTEGTLFQQQALYREGRMFWDSRNLQRLPDVNGNRAEIQDLTRGLQRGTAMAVRQSTHEDLMTTLKTAFARQYSDVVSAQDLATKDLKTIIAELRATRRSSTSPELRKRLNDAIELAKYLRLQLGTDSAVVPALREATIHVANWVGRMGVRFDNAALVKMGSWAEQFGQTVDPFRFARSVAFHTFMVFRPVRQLLLQSAQISYLLPLDPTYIASGRVFRDSLGLRRGIRKMTKENYADGWNDVAWAESMGLSKKEYKRLVEEFHRSGLLETVDVHTFNSSARQVQKIGLKDTAINRLYNTVRHRLKQGRDLFQKGFDIGEKNNLTFTYMIALRRAMKNKGVTSLTEFSRKDFDKIALDASNLALAMTRPNKFGYQGGAVGVSMQFLSFSHKAALGIIGKNPAISKAQGLKILLSGYLLFGANIFGAEDWAREQLAKMGLSRHSELEILPGIRLVDLLAGGLIESGFNAIGRATNEEWKDLDLGFLAPGVNTVQIYENLLEAVAESPYEAILGPFHNPASGFLQSLEFARNMVQHSDRTPSEKFLKVADALARGMLPGYNDANRAYLAYTMGTWLDKDGDKLPLRPVLNTILARVLLGVRSEEEMGYYRLQNVVWENEDNIRNAVDTNKTFLKELLSGVEGKKYGMESIYEMVSVLSSLYESWPEGIRREIYVRSLTEGDPENPSVIQTLAKIAETGSQSVDAIIPVIEAQADITQQEKKQLINMLQETARGHKEADKLMLDQLQQDLN
jgi:hypothetical protein